MGMLTPTMVMPSVTLTIKFKNPVETIILHIGTSALCTCDQLNVKCKTRYASLAIFTVPNKKLAQ